MEACNFIKKDSHAVYFPVKFAKFLKTAFLKESTIKRLLLKPGPEPWTLDLDPGSGPWTQTLTLDPDPAPRPWTLDPDLGPGPWKTWTLKNLE